MDELSDRLYLKISNLSDEGNIAFDQERWNDSINLWTEAYNLLPEPKSKWEAQEWLCVSLGDAFRKTNDTRTALTYFQEALNVAGSQDNPYLLLQLGKSLVDCGYQEDGCRYLMQAYLTEGKEIFSEEPKYLSYINI